MPLLHVEEAPLRARKASSSTLNVTHWLLESWEPK